MPPPFPHTSPTSRRLTRLVALADRRLAEAEKLSARYSRWRLLLFLTAAVAAVASFKLGWFMLGNGVVAAFVTLFVIVASYHNRLEARMHRWRLWRDVKRTHLARTQLEWAALPSRQHEVPPDHPYARDLDLIGPHSLLQLIDTTVSSNGRHRLTSWFLHQPRDEARWASRQQMVHELVPLTVFRDRLVLEGLLAGEHEINGERLQAVLLTPAGWPGLVPLLLVECTLAGLTLLLLALRLSGALPDYWMLSFGLYAFLFLFMDRSEHAFEHALSLQDELRKLGSVLAYVERRTPHLPSSLRTRCLALTRGESRPSQEMQRAARVVAGLSVRANPLAHILANLPVPWDLYFIWRLQQLQRELHNRLPTWLDILAEVEAASALGTFAWLHPDYGWPILHQPERVGSKPSGHLAAAGLGHPLLPAERRVTNHLRLDEQIRILLVTGSNMSGKSTYLRTAGLNLCLAQAGAPVCATSFAFSWMQLYCSIRVEDSIEAGLSHFYAEVKRLKMILEATRDRRHAPVFLLIDEIYSGTNNRERLIGSRAYVQELAKTTAAGLISTHDVELADLEQGVSTLKNVHFQETVTAGRLQFDYVLRPGPCPTTNALRIMAIEGLPVGERPNAQPEGPIANT